MNTSMSDSPLWQQLLISTLKVQRSRPHQLNSLISHCGSNKGGGQLWGWRRPLSLLLLLMLLLLWRCCDSVILHMDECLQVDKPSLTSCYVFDSFITSAPVCDPKTQRVRVYQDLSMLICTNLTCSGQTRMFVHLTEHFCNHDDGINIKPNWKCLFSTGTQQLVDTTGGFTEGPEGEFSFINGGIKVSRNGNLVKLHRCLRKTNAAIVFLV